MSDTARSRSPSCADLIDTVSFDSLVPGPRLLFLGGVHGDENPGMLALSRLLADLQAGKIRLLRGKVTVAARVNAGAAKRGLHFLEENLNRIVKRHDAPATHDHSRTQRPGAVRPARPVRWAALLRLMRAR